MPLIKIEEVAPCARLGLWHVTETASVLFGLYPQLLVHKPVTDEYRSEARRLEYLVVRVLLAQMEGVGVSISHADNGRPLLSNGSDISISHTRGYVAVIVSPCRRVAVDIEYISTRVARVASHFLRKDENAVSLYDKLLCWCAKETVYKFFSDDRLGFHDIRIHGALNGKNGSVTAENIKRNAVVDIRYCLTEDFMLTYIVGG